MYFKLQNSIANITILNVHILTKSLAEHETNDFYEEVEMLREMLPKHGTLIILDNMKSKVWKEDYTKDVAGKQTIYEVINENECNLARKLSLIAASTICKHTSEHKVTLILPGKITWNQIYHVN